MTNGDSRPLYRGTQVVWYIVTALEVLLLVRFLLRLLQANPYAGFTNFIYAFSGIFTAPFEAVFRNAHVEGSVFEWTTLLAMLVYYFIGVGLVKLFAMGRPVSNTEAQVGLRNEE